MNRKFLIIFILSFLLGMASATEIKIASLALFDSNGNSVDFFMSPSKIIYEELDKHWFEGLVSFSCLDEKKYDIPVTIVDANKICAIEHTDYLLYGFIKKNENNWQCELKLYDSNLKKNIKQFFASDDVEHSERMMEIICTNILTDIEEAMGINSKEIIKEKIRPFELKLPISAFYWTPVDEIWSSKMLGVAGGNIGLEFYPPLPKIVVCQKLFDFSLRPEFSYSYAMGKDGGYPLNYNAISFVLPLCVHLYFNARNSIYAGCGPYYEVQLLNVQPKYEDEKFLYQNMFGLESFIGYEFNVGRIVNLFTEVRCDFHFSEDTFISIKPGMGFSFNLYRGY